MLRLFGGVIFQEKLAIAGPNALPFACKLRTMPPKGENLEKKGTNPVAQCRFSPIKLC